VADTPLRQNSQSEQQSPAWLEVSLIVDGELAEAVAEVLARYIPNGVVIQATEIKQDEDGEAVGTGPLKVCGYLPVEPGVEETRRQLEQALWYLGRIQPLPEPIFTSIQPTNWAEAWKERYQPILVGKQLVIQPAWIEEVPPGRLPVRIDPGMAFGTGTHPTTQLCLEILERYAQPGMSTIDVGCGSGILSIAALRMGAARALAVDIDPEALEAAQENARLNGVHGRLETGLGSVDEIRARQFGLVQAPLVLANILAPVIIRLLDAGLADLVEPGGVLVLSGILEDQLEGRQGHVALLESLKKHNLSLIEKIQIQDWVALVIQC
jgi:ribosomal protein L11 methyltransferase